MDRKRSRTENGSQPGGGAAAVESSDSGADSDSDFDDFDDDGSQSAFSSDGEVDIHPFECRTQSVSIFKYGG